MRSNSSVKPSDKELIGMRMNCGVKNRVKKANNA